VRGVDRRPVSKITQKKKKAKRGGRKYCGEDDNLSQTLPLWGVIGGRPLEILERGRTQQPETVACGPEKLSESGDEWCTAPRTKKKKGVVPLTSRPGEGDEFLHKRRDRARSTRPMPQVHYQKWGASEWSIYRIRDYKRRAGRSFWRGVDTRDQVACFTGGRGGPQGLSNGMGCT